MEFNGDFLSDLNNDELMLEELGRRDGIYSFIFHELDAKNETDHPGVLVSDRPETLVSRNFGLDLMNVGAQNALVTNKYRKDQNKMTSQRNKNVNVKRETKTKWFESVAAAPPHLVMPSRHEFIRNYTAIASSSAKYLNTPFSPYYNSQNNRIPFWEPTSTAPLMDNGDPSDVPPNHLFRVRPPCPSFSHYSAPLIRNRRHALKETTAYKNTFKRQFAASEIPDLRHLFPHDPDVHAPFIELGITCNAAATANNTIPEAVKRDGPMMTAMEDIDNEDSTTSD